MVATPLRPERGPATVALHKLQQDTLGEIADLESVFVIGSNGGFSLRSSGSSAC